MIKPVCKYLTLHSGQTYYIMIKCIKRSMISNAKSYCMSKSTIVLNQFKCLFLTKFSKQERKEANIRICQSQYKMNVHAIRIIRKLQLLIHFTTKNQLSWRKMCLSMSTVQKYYLTGFFYSCSSMNACTCLRNEKSQMKPMKIVAIVFFQRYDFLCDKNCDRNGGFYSELALQ